VRQPAVPIRLNCPPEVSILTLRTAGPATAWRAPARCPTSAGLVRPGSDLQAFEKTTELSPKDTMGFGNLADALRWSGAGWRVRGTRGGHAPRAGPAREVPGLRTPAPAPPDLACQL